MVTPVRWINKKDPGGACDPSSVLLFSGCAYSQITTAVRAKADDPPPARPKPSSAEPAWHSRWPTSPEVFRQARRMMTYRVDRSHLPAPIHPVRGDAREAAQQEGLRWGL